MSVHSSQLELDNENRRESHRNSFTISFLRFYCIIKKMRCELFLSYFAFSILSSGIKNIHITYVYVITNAASNSGDEHADAHICDVALNINAQYCEHIFIALNNNIIRLTYP